MTASFVVLQLAAEIDVVCSHAKCSQGQCSLDGIWLSVGKTLQLLAPQKGIKSAAGWRVIDGVFGHGNLDFNKIQKEVVLSRRVGTQTVQLAWLYLADSVSLLTSFT